MRKPWEAYYEPQFSQHSHGFRPKKGCQTALIDIHETWTGTKWFIEGDIKGCFDNIDPHILMDILGHNALWADFGHIPLTSGTSSLCG